MDIGLGRNLLGSHHRPMHGQLAKRGGNFVFFRLGRGLEAGLRRGRAAQRQQFGKGRGKILKKHFFVLGIQFDDLTKLGVLNQGQV